MISEPILLVDDDQDVLDSLQEYMDSNGYAVETASTAEEALAAVTRREFPVVVMDLRLPGPLSGLDLAAIIRQRAPETLCILITGHATLTNSIQALKQGVYDLIQKPFRMAEISPILDRALDHARVLRQLAAYREELETRIYARSLELREARDEALQLCAWTAQAPEAPTEAEAIAPFLDRIAGPWAPEGIACYVRHGVEGRLACLIQRGPQPLPSFLTGGPTAPHAFGYGEEHGVVLGAAGWLYLGFLDRSAFSPGDPAFRLVTRHLELALRLRYRT
jgi:FixJ family two-component response regulator